MSSAAAESMIGNIPSWVDHMKVVVRRNNNRQKATSPQKRNSVYTRLSFVVIGKSFKYAGKSICVCGHVYALALLLTKKKQNRYGDKCQYAHGQDDLRDVERHPKYKTQVCRTFYQTGTCPYGTRCTFRHDENGLLLPASSALIQQQRPQLQQQPKLFHHHRNNRTCTYMTPAAWMTMTTHADAAQVPPSDSYNNNNVLLSSDAESLLPTGLLSDLDEPPSHIRPPVVGSMMLPCIPSSLVFQHGHQPHPPFNHNIWKQHQRNDNEGTHGTNSSSSSSFIPSFL